MSKQFERQLEQATDPTLLEPNWEGIMLCVDMVRSGDVPAKAAVASVLKRCQSGNPHVVHHTLLVLEAAVKNCGNKVHAEVATKTVMEDLRRLAMDSPADKVKEKVLELIQCWAHAFRDASDYKIVVDTHNFMKIEGFEFPSLREADAMFAAESAPDWVDGSGCFRCRAAFSLVNRRHHCRACGQIFCAKCSARQMNLPQYGIERMVRVCETCFEKSESAAAAIGGDGDAAAGEKGSPQKKKGAGEQSEAQVKAEALKQREAEELELAMAISQSEQEEKERQRQMQLYNLYNGPDSGDEAPTAAMSNGSKPFEYRGTRSNPPPKEGSPKSDAEPELAELSRYLNRNYWEQRKMEQKQGIRRESPEPSAPPPSESPAVSKQNGAPSTGGVQSAEPLLQNGDASADVDDTARFAATLKSQVEMFVNRIRSNQARGRSIVNDSSIQSLFLQLTGLHANVMQRMDSLDERRGYFESLQDRLAHIQEARQAVEALRDEHKRRRAAELEEEQRRRQAQMMQKLDLMRLKKHEMLEQQRMMALQRFQQQQQELQMRRQMAQAAYVGAFQQQQQVAPADGAGGPTMMQGAPPQQQQQFVVQQNPQAAFYPAGAAPITQPPPPQYAPTPQQQQPPPQGTAFNVQAMMGALPPPPTTQPFTAANYAPTPQAAAYMHAVPPAYQPASQAEMHTQAAQQQMMAQHVAAQQQQQQQQQQQYAFHAAPPPPPQYAPPPQQQQQPPPPPAAPVEPPVGNLIDFD